MATGLDVDAELSFPPASSPNDSVANEHAESRSLSQVLREANNNRCLPCQTKHDIALVFRNDEEDVADSIKEEMKKLTYNGKPLNLDVRLFSDEAAFGSNTVTKPYIICKSCWIMFIVHTDDKNRNLESPDFASEEVIAEVRIIGRQDNVLPLHTKPGLQPPIGLASMSPMKWFQEGKRSESLLGIIDHQRKKRGESEMRQGLEQLQLSDEDAYTMTGDPKGVCVIINNTIFDNPYYNRHSSQEQNGKLKQLFERFKFKVFSFENKTKEEMMGIFENVSKKDCRNCFVCFLMSHGRYNEVMSKDHKAVNIEEIASLFRPAVCPALDGKPKCFFVDSCRLHRNIDMPDPPNNDDTDVSTAQHDNPDQLQSTASWESLPESDRLSFLRERLAMYNEALVNAKDASKQRRLKRSIKILEDLCKHPQSVKEADIPSPVDVGNRSGNLPRTCKPQNENLWTKDQVQDFFFGYATQEDDTSLRSNEHGDIYTDEFIKAMEERAHKEDLVSIMTTVTRQVKKRTIYDKFGKKCWQLPKFDTLLNKKLYFN